MVKKSVSKSKSAKNEKQTKISIPGFKKLSRERLIVDLIILACIVLVGITAWVWWSKILMNPDRALQDTISNSLQVKSITKKTEQPGAPGGINVSQVSYLSFFPSSEIRAEAKRTIKQNLGDNSPEITTELIGTKSTDYISYTDAKNTESIPSLKNLNGVIGVWTKSNDAILLGGTVYSRSPILFGDLDTNQLSQLTRIINDKNVYKYSSVERKIENKRPVYVYQMNINVKDLLATFKTYSELTGLGDPSSFESNQYQAGTIHIRLTLDILSRQLVKIEDATGQSETYSGQNLYQPIEIPAGTIPVEELQRRLQGASA